MVATMGFFSTPDFHMPTALAMLAPMHTVVSMERSGSTAASV